MRQRPKHKRNHTNEQMRIIEDSELPVIQCDYLMLKDVAATSGLKVLSTYVRTFGYGMSAAVEMKAQQTRSQQLWAVKMLNFLGLSDVILQCDPEPSLIKWAERCQVQTIRTNSHSKFSQTVTSERRRSRKLSETAAGTSACNVGPTADSALMRWIVRPAAWLIPRFRGSDVQSPLYRAMGGPYRGKLVEFGEKQFLHIFQRLERDLEIPRRSWQDRWKSGVWLGKSDLTRRALCPNRRWRLNMREVYDDSQSTTGQKRTSSQSPRPHRSRGRRQPLMQQIPEQFQNHMNTRNRMRSERQRW